MSEFYTILKTTEGEYKEKGSKFLSFAFPVESMDEVEQALQGVKKKYHDARHHCYGYLLGLANQDYRANDDGEPAHSAGDPILGQIRSYQLTNVLVVVVRYFGGTKLGVGGLIHAYRTAADEALAKAGKKEIFEEVKLNFKFPYEILSTIERLIAQFEITVINRDFQEDCRIQGLMKAQLVDQLQNKTVDLYNLELSITE